MGHEDAISFPEAFASATQRAQQREHPAHPDDRHGSRNPYLPRGHFRHPWSQKSSLDVDQRPCASQQSPSSESEQRARGLPLWLPACDRSTSIAQLDRVCTPSRSGPPSRRSHSPTPPRHSQPPRLRETAALLSRFASIASRAVVHSPSTRGHSIAARSVACHFRAQFRISRRYICFLRGTMYPRVGETLFGPWIMYPGGLDTFSRAIFISFLNRNGRWIDKTAAQDAPYDPSFPRPPEVSDSRLRRQMNTQHDRQHLRNCIRSQRRRVRIRHR